MKIWAFLEQIYGLLLLRFYNCGPFARSKCFECLSF